MMYNFIYDMEIIHTTIQQNQYRLNSPFFDLLIKYYSPQPSGDIDKVLQK